jgi:exodeoxyribonuclease-1
VTFYFYDLETSGVNPRASRIMQFAGQRTDMNLKPVGKPDNFLIKLTEDVLPDPEAVLIHGITPQRTRAEGLTEAAAAKYLTSQVFKPDTIAVGFNNIRFDDEFVRFLLWRNFHDAYQWQWQDGRSKWDLLDLARMTRALRPEGIEWPFASDGTPSNRLELLAAVNKLDHVNVHDAMSDVTASIALARLIRNKQTKLFDYLLRMRDKSKVGALVGKGLPFLYSSGRYPSEYEKTTVAVMLAAHPDRAAALVYDLRVNPDDFSGLSPAQLAKLWQLRGKDAPYFPIKKLIYNRCPAVAPLSVLDSSSAVRLKIDSSAVDENFAKLKKAQDFGDKLIAALEIMEPGKQPELIVNELSVDAQLYDGFVPDGDKTKMSVVRAADAESLADLSLDFADERLTALLPLYKARNFMSSLTTDEQAWWGHYKHRRLSEGGEQSALSQYFSRLDELIAQPGLGAEQRGLLEELKLYGQSVIPAP